MTFLAGVAIGVGTMAFVASGLLLAADGSPKLLSAAGHEAVAAISLALIAVAYLAFQRVRRSAPLEWVKAVMLAAAFLFWAANQLWPELREHFFFNDVAIALFVLDVLLGIMGWPKRHPRETGGARVAEPRRASRAS